MRSRLAVEKVIDDLARGRVLKYIRGASRGGQSVVTLVDILEETALDPGTVKAVMAQLESGPGAPVRPGAADQLRRHTDDRMSGYGLPDWVRYPECTPLCRIVTFPRSTVDMTCRYCGEKTVEIVRAVTDDCISS